MCRNVGALTTTKTSPDEVRRTKMKTRNLHHIVGGLVVTAIFTGLFPSQTEGASPCPPPPAGTALVTVPTGGFALDGDLQANTPVSGIGDWGAGSSGSGGFGL